MIYNLLKNGRVRKECIDYRDFKEKSIYLQKKKAKKNMNFQIFIILYDFFKIKTKREWDLKP